MSAPVRGRAHLAAARVTAVLAALGSAAFFSVAPATAPATLVSGPAATAQVRTPGVLIAPATTAGPVTRVIREGSMTAGAVVNARSTSASGYLLGVGGLLGETPAGLHVWVNPRAPHHVNLAGNAKATVALWQKLGLKATYKGYGTPRLREGVITVTEGVAGCTGGHAGMTWHTTMPLPGHRSYMHSARVVICPTLYRYASWQWSATVRHELGHAAGLGHFDGVYRGSTQVMRSVNHAPVSSFRAGDMNGLRYLAGNNTRVRRAIPPHGRLEAALPGLRVTGWAMLAWYRDKPVNIEVTDNGRWLTTAATSVYRADINTLYDRGTTHRHGFSIQLPLSIGIGTHKVCLTAVSPVQSTARVNLGCATWG